MSQLYQLFTVGICIFLTEYKDTIGFDYFILKPKKKKVQLFFLLLRFEIQTWLLFSYNIHTVSPQL